MNDRPHGRDRNPSVPAISVVMTVFNGEPFVHAAVGSILQQSFEDFEFIVVDNASTDASCAIVESFKDPRIRVIRCDENLGQTRALNLGIRNARAPLVARMDADDIAERRRFELQAAYLQENAGVSVVGSSARFIDGNGRYLRTFNPPCRPDIVTLHMAGSPDLSFGCTLHPTLMIRRSAFESAGLFEEPPGTAPGFPQDYELWFRMITQHLKFANLRTPLLQYRVSSGSESSAHREASLRHRLRISARKVRFYCPGFSDDETLALARMLEFKAQESRAAGDSVLGLFDAYFAAYADHSGLGGTGSRIGRRMKLFYLPVLFLTNKALALRRYAEFVARDPRLLADAKFLRKLAKVAVSRGSVEQLRGFRPADWY